MLSRKLDELIQEEFVMADGKEFELTIQRFRVRGMERFDCLPESTY